MATRTKVVLQFPRVVLRLPEVAIRTDAHTLIKSRVLVENGAGVIRVDSALRAFRRAASVANKTAVIAGLTVPACHVGIVTTGTAGQTAVRGVVEVVANWTALSRHAVVRAVVAGLAEEGALLAVEVDGAVDELPLRTLC